MIIISKEPCDIEDWSQARSRGGLALPELPSIVHPNNIFQSTINKYALSYYTLNKDLSLPEKCENPTENEQYAPRSENLKDIF